MEGTNLRPECIIVRLLAGDRLFTRDRESSRKTFSDFFALKVFYVKQGEDVKISGIAFNVLNFILNTG